MHCWVDGNCDYATCELLKGNCNQNLYLVFIDLIQSTTSITIDTQVLLWYFNSITRYKALKLNYFGFCHFVSRLLRDVTRGGSKFE